METTTITIYKASQGHWLYKDEVSESGRVIRTFAPQVMNADENWHECTDAEKQEWEEAHKPADIPEPPQVEETQAEEVTDEY